MGIVLIIAARAAIWLTFLLLITEGVVALVWARRFYELYVRKHRELEVLADAHERRLRALEEASK